MVNFGGEERINNKGYERKSETLSLKNPKFRNPTLCKPNDQTRAFKRVTVTYDSFLHLYCKLHNYLPPPIMSKQNSPPSVAFRMSDLSNDMMTSLDFLGFKLDTFMCQVRANPHGNSISNPFRHPTAEEVDELQRYAAAKGYNVRLKYDLRGSYLQVLYDVHEIPGALFAAEFSFNNRDRTHQHLVPVKCLGTGNTMIHNAVNQPDLKTRVKNRNHNSPNFMLESRFRNDQTDHQFHSRLLSFFTGAADVMLVVGISIGNRNPQGLFEALIVVYGRDQTNLPEVLYNVSFGTAEVDPGNIWDEAIQAALAPINPAAVVPAMVGVGVGGPACTAETGGEDPYLITLPQELMLCVNWIWPYEYNLAPEYGPMEGHDYTVNLFNLQEELNEELPPYVALIA